MNQLLRKKASLVLELYQFYNLPKREGRYICTKTYLYQLFI